MATIPTAITGIDTGTLASSGRRAGRFSSLSTRSAASTNNAVKAAKMVNPIGVRSARVFRVPVAAPWRRLIQRSRKTHTLTSLRILAFLILPQAPMLVAAGPQTRFSDSPTVVRRSLRDSSRRPR